MVGCRADKVSWFSFRPYSYNSNFWNFRIWYLKNDASDTFEAFKCPPLFFNLSVDLWSNFLSSDGCFCLFWRSYVHSKHHAFCVQQPFEKCLLQKIGEYAAPRNLFFCFSIKYWNKYQKSGTRIFTDFFSKLSEKKVVNVFSPNLLNSTITTKV